MSRKLNKLEILIYDIKTFFSKDNLYNEVFPKLCPSCKSWKVDYYKLLEDYCTIIYKVTDGILSYKHYKPEDILMLDEERINRIIYEDRLEQLENIISEVKDYPTIEDVMITLDEYRQEAEDGYECYKRN